MPIVVTDALEFEHLIDALGNDLVAAAIHLRLHRDIRLAAAEYSRELNEANTFWSLTLNAHLQHGLHCLCRAYDQQRRALSLRTWLETILENLPFFDREKFRERLRANAFVDSLAEATRAPDVVSLDQHIKLCSASDPLVQRLVQIRNRVLGHRSGEHAARGTSPYVDCPLTFVDIDALLERGLTIYNTYNRLFRAATHSTQIVGHEDFLHVLAAVRHRLEHLERELADD